MLNLAYINNYLFLFFFLKNRSYRHYVSKEGEHPPIRKKMAMRKHYPCHKQLAGSVYCGYDVCEHVREFGRYTKDLEPVSIYYLLG
jgi:hypothetical protein